MELKTKLWQWCKQDTGNVGYLASEINVSPAFISSVINNKKKLPVEQLRNVQRVTGIHPRDLRPDINSIFED